MNCKHCGCPLPDYRKGPQLCEMDRTLDDINRAARRPTKVLIRRLKPEERYLYCGKCERTSPPSELWPETVRCLICGEVSHRIDTEVKPI